MENTLTYTQKFYAMKALGETSIEMTNDGTRWFVSIQGLQIKEGPTLRLPCGFADHPTTAIQTCWDEITRLEPDAVLVRERNGTRQTIRWTGFMWEVTTT